MSQEENANVAVQNIMERLLKESNPPQNSPSIPETPSSSMNDTQPQKSLEAFGSAAFAASSILVNVPTDIGRTPPPMDHTPPGIHAPKPASSMDNLYAPDLTEEANTSKSFNPDYFLPKTDPALGNDPQGEATYNIDSVSSAEANPMAQAGEKVDYLDTTQRQEFFNKSTNAESKKGLLFPETKQTVGGLFLDRWKESGGLAQHGYPISEMFYEVSKTDGKLYAVQYFERDVFQYHPENQSPHNVLLTLAGVEALKRDFPLGAPAGEVDNSPGAVKDEFTNHTVGDKYKFKSYIDSHGGIPIFGRPLTEVLKRRSPTDGNMYNMQYFERAVAEYHPENKPPYDVLLALLGVEEQEENYVINPDTGDWHKKLPDEVDPGTGGEDPPEVGVERFPSEFGKWHEINTDIPNHPGVYVAADIMTNNELLMLVERVDYKGRTVSGAQLAWESHLEAIAVQAPQQSDGTVLDTETKVSNYYRDHGQIEYYIPRAVTPPPGKENLGHSWLAPFKVTHRIENGLQFYEGDHTAEGGSYRRGASNDSNSIGAGIIIKHFPSQTGPGTLSREFYTANALIAYMGETLDKPNEFDANAAASQSNKNGASSTPIDRDKYYTYSGPEGFTKVMFTSIPK